MDAIQGVPNRRVARCTYHHKQLNVTTMVHIHYPGGPCPHMKHSVYRLRLCTNPCNFSQDTGRDRQDERWNVTDIKIMWHISSVASSIACLCTTSTSGPLSVRDSTDSCTESSKVISSSSYCFRVLRGDSEKLRGCPTRFPDETQVPTSGRTMSRSVHSIPFLANSPLRELNEVVERDQGT